ncbi:MAG: hypothetical protein FJX72_03095 [Armatimonadetes bacterium]|nr:hypothetical protein [Armatimonadota bacterium]
MTALVAAVCWCALGPGSDALQAASNAIHAAVEHVKSGRAQGPTAAGGTQALQAPRSDPVALHSSHPSHPSHGSLRLSFQEAEIDGTLVKARDVELQQGEYELRGLSLEGDLEGMLLFTGDPSLTYRGQTLFGDSIRFFPKTRAYRIDNLRSSLSPDFLQGRATAPLFLSGGSVAGRDRDPLVASDSTATSCDRPEPHYAVSAGSIEVEPGKRLTLRRAAIAYRGKRIVTLPTVMVPLDRRIPRGGYQPYVGRSAEEGWFVKTGFNYTLGDRAPGMYRVDLMERKGIGLGLEQAWSTTSSRIEAVLYGTPAGGQGSNVSGRMTGRFQIGDAHRFDIGYDMRENDYRGLPDSGDRGVRLGYGFRLGGYETLLNLNSRSNRSGAYQSSSETASFSQRVTFAQAGAMSVEADYSRYESGSAGTAAQVNERMTARLHGDYRGPNYVLQLAANRNVPIGGGASQSYFGGVERLPEIGVSQFRFTRGALAKAPITLNVGAGVYSEGGASGAARTASERVSAGFDLASLRLPIRGSTELNVGAGFMQYLYREGSAQYVLRSNSSFTSRWGAKSGVNVRYTYQQPHGGTPFRFDQQGKYHSLSGDLGWFDDERLQVSARVGYDLAGVSYGGVREPWQTLSANVLVKPADWFRLRTLLSMNPNSGQFSSVTSDLRIRGPREFALDLVSRYDPRTHRFGQVNAYLSVPVLPNWRAVVLTQYNGYLSRFESRNLQIIHDMHCMEASLTFIDNPYGWRADRQVMFQLRIKAFPAFQQFGTGLYGQALDTSVGGDF